MNFSVDVDFSESAIAIGVIIVVSSYEELNDVEIHVFIESRSVESKAVLTLEKMDKTVK